MNAIAVYTEFAYRQHRSTTSLWQSLCVDFKASSLGVHDVSERFGKAKT